jgi:hypothetical protein
MSVFGSIVSAIFGSKHAATVTAPGGSPPPSSSASPASPRSAAAAPAGAPSAQPVSKADVEAILAKLADEQNEDLAWKTSIVDLMKLLKLDSSLGARKQLAQELGYTGGAGWLGGDERLAAKAGHDQACRKRRQGAGQSQGMSEALTPPVLGNRGKAI